MDRRSHTVRAMTTHGFRSTLVRRGAVVALVVGALAALGAAPASAQISPDDGSRRLGVGDQFVPRGDTVKTAEVAIDGKATVAGTTTKSVYVVSGNAVISGRVHGDVIVIDGDARISGRVDDDVVVIKGRAILADGAVVGGDVKSTDEPNIERGARVSGNVENIDTTGWFTAIGFTILGYLWLAITVSIAVLGVLLLALFRRPIESAAATARSDTGKAIGLWLGVAIGLPIISIVAISTLVGLPFGLGFLGASGLLWALGYATAALCLGRIIIQTPRNAFAAFFAGWGILRVLALIPGLGFLVWVGASVFGLGALTLAALRGSRGAPTTPAATDALPVAAD